jgi:hypothetical protein
MSSRQRNAITRLCKVVSLVARVMLSVIPLPTQSHALVVTQSVPAACTRDVSRLCGSEILNDDGVIARMRA